MHQQCRVVIYDRVCCHRVCVSANLRMIHWHYRHSMLELLVMARQVLRRKQESKIAKGIT